jgi:hypothetical protein
MKTGNRECRSMNSSFCPLQKVSEKDTKNTKDTNAQQMPDVQTCRFHHRKKNVTHQRHANVNFQVGPPYKVQVITNISSR